MNHGPKLKYFVDLHDIMNMNSAFNIVKEVRHQWSKTSKSTIIIDKKSIIQGVRSSFKDDFIVRLLEGESIVSVHMTVMINSEGNQQDSGDGLIN